MKCSLLLASFFFALSSFIAVADPGFTHIENPFDLPEFLPQQRTHLKANIFQFVELLSTPISVADYQEKFLAQVPERLRNSVVFTFAVKEKEKCQIEKKGEDCELPTLSTGTAFIAKFDGHQDSYLWTNFHVAKKQLVLAEERGVLTQSEIEKMNVPLKFVLLNSNGKVAYDSRSEGETKIKFASRSKWGWSGNLLENLVSADQALDFILIQLNRSLSDNPLKFSEESNRLLFKSSLVYMAGFPDKTHNRFDLYQSNDSDGRSLYLSYGWTTGATHAWSLATGQRHADGSVSSGEMIVPIMEQLLEKYYMNLGLENISGSSGSPLLNAEGKIVGIYVGSMGDGQEEKYIDFRSLGLQTEWIKTFLDHTHLSF